MLQHLALQTRQAPPVSLMTLIEKYRKSVEWAWGEGSQQLSGGAAVLEERSLLFGQSECERP
eukprot:6474149-Amphidinium_carterae.1